jgi:hypothetical protein
MPSDTLECRPDTPNARKEIDESKTFIALRRRFKGQHALQRRDKVGLDWALSGLPAAHRADVNVKALSDLSLCVVFTGLGEVFPSSFSVGAGGQDYCHGFALWEFMRTLSPVMYSVKLFVLVINRRTGSFAGAPIECFALVSAIGISVYVQIVNDIRQASIGNFYNNVYTYYVYSENVFIKVVLITNIHTENDMQNVTKRDAREKFVELANKRVTKAIKDLRLIGNLANRRAYKYEDADAKKIIRALQRELDVVKARFHGDEGNEDSIFSL